jgi:hypothetical protein
LLAEGHPLDTSSTQSRMEYHGNLYAAEYSVRFHSLESNCSADSRAAVLAEFVRTTPCGTPFSSRGYCCRRANHFVRRSLTVESLSVWFTSSFSFVRAYRTELPRPICCAKGREEVFSRGFILQQTWASSRSHWAIKRHQCRSRFSRKLEMSDAVREARQRDGSHFDTSKG